MDRYSQKFYGLGEVIDITHEDAVEISNDMCKIYDCEESELDVETVIISVIYRGVFNKYVDFDCRKFRKINQAIDALASTKGGILLEFENLRSFALLDSMEEAERFMKEFSIFDKNNVSIKQIIPIDHDQKLVLEWKGIPPYGDLLRDLENCFNSRVSAIETNSGIEFTIEDVVVNSLEEMQAELKRLYQSSESSQSFTLPKLHTINGVEFTKQCIDGVVRLDKPVKALRA